MVYHAWRTLNNLDPLFAYGLYVCKNVQPDNGQWIWIHSTRNVTQLSCWWYQHATSYTDCNSSKLSRLQNHQDYQILWKSANNSHLLRIASFFNQLLDKLPKVCVQTLNNILPPKEDLTLPFGHYVSRVIKNHSAGMMYSIDITWEPMGRHGFRIVWIFQQTKFYQTSVGNVDVPWHQLPFSCKN